MLYVMQEGEIAALKQDLKKQQEQAEKWVKISLYYMATTYFITPNECLCYVSVIFNIQENDCMALKLKYRDAVQKKEVAEKNLTKRVRLKLCSILASYAIS